MLLEKSDQRILLAFNEKVYCSHTLSMSTNLTYSQVHKRIKVMCFVGIMNKEKFHRKNEITLTPLGIEIRNMLFKVNSLIPNEPSQT